MIDSEYYNNYRGPDLTRARLNDKDITELIKEKYGGLNNWNGELNNWNGKLYTFSDIFGEDSLNKNIYCEFKDETGRIHWFHSFIDDLNQYFNPPLATPMQQ